MPVRFRVRPALALAAALLVPAAHAARPAAAPAPAAADPIQREIDRFQERIATTTPADEESKGAREFATPLLALSEKAIADGKRWFALARLSFLWTSVEAADYRAGYPAELRSQISALEKEFAAFEPTLAEMRGAGRPSFAEAPAIARAVGEVALSELDVYYASSIDYGKATAAEFGLYYIGAAKAQVELARFAASLREPGATARPLEPRSAAREITAAEDELLAAYVPPASVDQHGVFIRISSLLKQARELDDAGQRYGALYKLLDAKMRIARLVHPERKMDSAEANRRAWALSPTLAATGADSSILDTFVQIALVQVADPDPQMLGPETAAAVFDEVVPLYFTILGPAPPAPPEQVAETTVTLIRWPYT